jgi:hypothetical protein
VRISSRKLPPAAATIEEAEAIVMEELASWNLARCTPESRMAPKGSVCFLK